MALADKALSMCIYTHIFIGRAALDSAQALVDKALSINCDYEDARRVASLITSWRYTYTYTYTHSCQAVYIHIYILTHSCVTNFHLAVYVYIYIHTHA